MRNIIIENDGTIFLGKTGENLATQIQFPLVEKYRATFGEGTFQLLVKRATDEHPYAVSLTLSDDKVCWSVENTDVAIAGYGSCELQYFVGETLAKSLTWRTKVIEGMGEAGEAPEPWQSWIDDVLAAGSQAQESAQEAKESELNAKESEENALASAESASESEENARIYAGNASASASSAYTSEQNSAESAQNALEAMISAEASEQLASASASSASSSATSASAAKDAAESAKTSAETASSSASASATSASVSAASASQNATAAQNYAQEIEDLTVSAHIISAGSNPTVTKTKVVGQPYNIDFGVPAEHNVDVVAAEIAQIEKNLFTLKESIGYPHTFIQATGALKTRADYNFIVTKLLPVSAGQTIAYKIYHTQALPIVALYNSATISAASYIGNVTGIRGWREGTYTVPSDGYIAFSMSSAYLDESYIKFTDNIPNNIEAYVKSAISASSFLPQKILCFGDSILGNDGQTVEHLAEYTGSQVLNAAVGGTSVSPRTSTGNIYFPLDGENLITAFTTGDWSAQNAVKSQHTQQVRERIDMLQALDASTIDLIILAWGTNDYTQGKTIEQITASLGHCIDMLQETYPLCRILVLCNTWRFFSLTSDSDSMVYNVSTGKEIANAIEDFCTNRRISVMNGYKLMETSLKNATTYFDNVTTGGDDDQQSGIEVPSGSGQYYSGVHYNDAGNKMYAHLINGKIRSMY